MYHNYKRAIAFILSMAMLITLFPSFVFSDDAEAGSSTVVQQVEAVTGGASEDETESETPSDAEEGGLPSANSEEEGNPSNENGSPSSNEPDSSIPVEGENPTNTPDQTEISEGNVDNGAVPGEEPKEPETTEGLEELEEVPSIVEDEGTSEGALQRLPRRLDNVYEVSFITPDGTAKKFSQYVTEGATAYDPGPAEVPTPNLNNFVSFLGWYIYTVPETSPFDFVNTPITEETELWARYSRDYLISYLNGFNEVFMTKRVNPSAFVPDLTPQEKLEFTAPDGEYLDHWNVLNEAGLDVGTVFVPNTIYPDRDITLKPITNRGVFNVYFVSEGSQVTFQAIKYGEKAVKPANPTRNGYIFDRWSTTSSGGVEFDFDSPITENTMLFALWTPSTVTYQIVFFNEKANIIGEPGSGDYEFSRAFTGSGIAGTRIADLGVKDFVAAHSADWPKYSTYYEGINSNGFVSNSNVLLGNNSTVINVYFRRNVYDLYFSLVAARIGGYNPTYFSSIISSLQFYDPPGAPTYVTTESALGMYKISAKFEQNIGDLWPSSGNANLRMVSSLPSSSMNGSSAVLMGWVPLDAAGVPLTPRVITTRRPTMTEDLITEASSNRPLRIYYQITQAQVYKWNYHYMFEQLEGEVASESFNGKDYVESTDYSQLNVNSLTKSIYLATIKGLTATTSYAQYKTGTGTFESLPSSTFGSSNVSVDIYLFYNRNKWSLTFDLMSNKASVQKNPSLDYESIKFGEELDAYIPTTNPSLVDDKVTYSFEGWYYDSDFQKPYTAGDKLSNGNVTLYAKWRAIDYSVSLYNDLTKNDKIGEFYIERGGYINPAELPYVTGTHYSKGTFLGWMYYMGSETFWFNVDTTPITQKWELHAVWQTSAHTVTYNKSLDPTVTGAPPEDPNLYLANAVVRVKGNENGMVKPPETDYTFVGWKKMDNHGVLGSTSYYEGSFVVIEDEDIEFYPQFSPKADTILVKFYKNDEVFPEEVVDRTLAKQSEIPMPNELIFGGVGRPGYILAGWTLDRNDISRGLYKPNDIYTLGDFPVNFYAYWVEPNMVRVAFDLKDKVDGIEYGTTSDQTIYYVEVGKSMMASGVRAPKVTPDEYHRFEKWSASYDETQTFDPYYSPVSNVTYTAIYSTLSALKPGLVTVLPYYDIYDAKYHSVTVTLDSTIAGYAPQYSTNGGIAWSLTNPAYKDVNGKPIVQPYPVWVKVKVADSAPFITESSVTITRRALDITAPSRTIRVGALVPTDSAWKLTFAGFAGSEGLVEITTTGNYDSFHLNPSFVVNTPGVFATIVEDEFSSNNYDVKRHDGELVVAEAESAGSLTKQIWDGAKYADALHVTDKNATLQYRIRFILPTDMGGYSTLEVQDILPASLKPAADSDNVVILVNGTPFNDGTPDIGKYGGTVISYTFNPSSFSYLQGKTVDMIVKTELVNKNFAGSIRNYGRVLVNKTTPPEQPVSPPSSHVAGPNVVVTNPMDSIVKTIWDPAQGKFVDSLSITDPTQILKYQIAVKMPTSMAGITSIEIQDILPAQLVLNSPPPTPVEGANVWVSVSGGATISGTLAMKAEGGKNIVSFRTAELTLIESLAGKTVLMTVDTKLVAGAKGRILNQVKVIKNDDGEKGEDGDPPYVTVLTPITNVAKGVYNGSAYVTHFEVQDRTRPLVYRINAEIPADVTSYSSIELQDVLPDALTLASISVHYISGSTETEVSVVAPVIKKDALGRTIVSYTVSDQSLINTLAGKTLRLTVRANIKVTNPAFVGKITNTGNVILNGEEPVVTNPVDVIVTNPIEDITKRIWNGTEFVDGLNIVDKTEVFKYQISIKMPSDVTSYTSIELQDILPDSLRLANNNVAVDVQISVSGGGVTLNGSLSLVDGHIVSYLINDLAIIKQLEGKTVIMTVDARLTADAKGIIENIGCVLVNGSNGQDDTPKVVVTEPIGGISKTIKDPETGSFGNSLMTQDRNQVLTYRVTAQIPADVTSYTSIELIDILPASLRLNGTIAAAARVYVISGGTGTLLSTGNITTTSALGKTTVSYVLSNIATINSLTGKALSLEIDTKIVDPTFTGRIYNEGFVKVNGVDPKQAETPYVIVTEPMSKVDKQVKAADGTWGDSLQITDGTQVLTYRIAATLPVNTTSYVSIEIQDILPASLQLANGSTAVDVTVSVSEGGVDLSTQLAPILKGGNIVSYTITGEAILAALAGKTVVMEVRTKLVDKDFNGAITNKGKVIVNNKNENDDPNPPKLIVTEPIGGISKTIKDPETGSFGNSLWIQDRNQVLTYRVTAQIPADVTSYTGIELIDILPASLRLNGTVVAAARVYVISGGADTLLSAGNITTTSALGKTTVSYVLSNIATINSLTGKALSLEIDTRIVDPTFTGRIYNEGFVKVNGADPKQAETPYVIVTEPMSKVDKQVQAANGTWGDSLKITDKTQVLTYRIVATLPTNTTSYTSIEIQDILPASLTLASVIATDVTVRVSEGGVDLSGQAAPILKGGNIVSYTITGEAILAALAGKTVVMEVKTKLADKDFSGEITNVGRVIVNDKNKKDDINPPKVTVTDPDDPPYIRFMNVSLRLNIPLSAGTFQLRVDTGGVATNLYFTSSMPDVASINASTGLVTFVRGGTTTINAYVVRPDGSLGENVGLVINVVR